VAKPTTKGVIRVVCKSSEGNFLGASAVFYEGVTCPRTLDALTCREGLALRMILIFVQSFALDCLEVVFSSVLAEINDRIQQRGNTTFGHERKEFNEEAHNLYRYAFDLAMCGSENLAI
jgi:hypothetical protein